MIPPQFYRMTGVVSNIIRSHRRPAYSSLCFRQHPSSLISKCSQILSLPSKGSEVDLNSMKLSLRSQRYSLIMRNQLRTQAFTLIEMLIVIGLIAAIMSIVVVNFGGTSEQAKFQLVDTFVNNSVAVPLESYKSVHGNYPSTEQGLAILMQPLPRTQQAPLKKLGDDPWGQPYRYRFPGKENPGSYDIWSIGPDGKDGTTDDVGNWD